MNAASPPSLHTIVWTALLAALVAAGAYIHIPLGPVPISLQTMFVLLCGFVLGPRRGMIAIALYLGAGFVGLPVFAGGASGFAHLFGPTGGYMVGFAACAGLAGMAVRKKDAKPTWKALLLWGALGQLALYAIGVPRLAMVIDASLGKAFSVGMLPFLPGAALKLVAAASAARFLHGKGLLQR